MGLRLVTPAEDEIITLAEAKSFMRVDTSDDDDLITSLIAAARDRIEGTAGRLNVVFMPQTWELVLDKFPTSEIMLPLAPVQSITSITYYDEDGLAQTVSSADYFLDAVSRPPYVILQGDADWPDTLDAANSVSVVFLAGFPEGGSGDAAGNVPATVKLAVKQLVSHWYERRDLVSEAANVNVIPEFVWALLHRYRMFL